MENEKSRPFVARWRDAVLSADGPPKPMTRYVLDVLTKYMNGDGGNCYPSTRTLAEATGLSERSVCEHLRHATENGWLSKSVRGNSGQGWRRHRYVPLLPSLLKGTDGESARITEGTDAESVTESKGTDPHDVKALTLTHKGTDGGSVEGSIEGSSEQGKTRARPTGLPESVSDELWSAFVDHRKKIKRPMTEKAESMLATKLAGMEDQGHDASEALRESIINVWLGVFPPKAGDHTVRASKRKASPSDFTLRGFD